jgi:zeaxanthin epoxidase
VGGLTAALGLLKKGFDVTLYEKTGKFLRFGGPIQFASNSLSSLKAIDENLFRRIMDKFTFTGTRRCGIKDGLRADGKFSMTPVADPRYLFDDTVPADWYVEFPLKQCADFFKLPYTGVINRPDLQEILLDECQKIKPDFIINGVSVKRYENTPDGVTVELSDGSSVSADVLVGADGIWSSVRAQMYNEGEVKAKSKDGWKQQGCAYSGYTVFAGEFVPENIEDFSDYFDCGYKVYIGPKKYFVTSDVGDGRVQWYSFLAQPPGTKRAGDSWEGGESSSEQGTDVISYLKGLHEGWTDEIHYVLDNTPAASVEQRDLYDRWPEFFRSWSDDSVVLLGDAVHPMMPNLGQGGGMAIEDSYELSELLRNAVDEAGGKKPEPEVLRAVLQSFYEKRVGRVAGVSLLSRLASDLIINFFGTPWSPHDSKGQGILSYLTFFWKPILQYIVFPLQFLFLYSYHPTGQMGDLPKQLEAAWRERHRPSAMAAFAKAKAEGQSAGGASFFAVANN